MSQHDMYSALDKLERFAWARDRNVDKEPREIVLTDDEGAALLTWIHEMAPTDE